MSGYHVEPVESAPFAEISYVIWLEGSRDALVVDPGYEPEAIMEIVRLKSLEIVAILNTHGHIDHIAGNPAMKKLYPQAPIVIGRNEAELLTNSKKNLSEAFGNPFKSPPADLLLDEGQSYDAAGFVFEIREIPGHSPGSIVFICRQFPTVFVFGGDVLFAGSVGRTDFGGKRDQLVEGIKTKLFDLPDDTIVYPGHGSFVNIGREKKTNPYVGERAGLTPLG